MSSFDIDGDGRPEILAGNHMFSYEKSGKWRATRIGDIGGLIFAGRFIQDAKIPQVVIAPGRRVRARSSGTSAKAIPSRRRTGRGTTSWAGR